ncbi:hypothetical protein GWN49_04500 [Candidatus Bathyarchaeota archaeon]|nr:hypothetical protein [Candidatus Bathyarchaeota archaeon]
MSDIRTRGGLGTSLVYSIERRIFPKPEFYLAPTTSLLNADLPTTTSKAMEDEQRKICAPSCLAFP